MKSALRLLVPAFTLGLALHAAACSDGASDDPWGPSTSATTTTGSGGGGGGGGSVDAYANAVKSTDWTKLAAAPSVPGGAKQDDAYFLDASHGFLASGPLGAIYSTTDGGTSWNQVFTHDGTYFRAVLFLDAQHGFAGNIGAGLSPSIDDATLMYETKDGGTSWDPVTSITGSAAKGLCNFTQIDATHIVGVGRANGPAHMLTSSDAGATWVSKDLGSYFSMVIDAHFFSTTEGVVAGMDKSSQKCSIMRTTDGGETFSPAFESATHGTLCWKLSFPSPSVGYAAVQDTTTGPGTLAKTVDGGVTWTEMPLPVTDPPKKAYGAIGVGFIDEKIGWMSAEDPDLPTYRTFDGGVTWEVDPALLSPINRFRFIDAHTGYAIGGSVWKLEVPDAGN